MPRRGDAPDTMPTVGTSGHGPGLIETRVGSRRRDQHVALVDTGQRRELGRRHDDIAERGHVRRHEPAEPVDRLGRENVPELHLLADRFVVQVDEGRACPGDREFERFLVEQFDARETRPA